MYQITEFENAHYSKLYAQFTADTVDKPDIVWQQQYTDATFTVIQSTQECCDTDCSHKYLLVECYEYESRPTCPSTCITSDNTNPLSLLSSPSLDSMPALTFEVSSPALKKSKISNKCTQSQNNKSSYTVLSDIDNEHLNLNNINYKKRKLSHLNDNSDSESLIQSDNIISLNPNNAQLSANTNEQKSEIDSADSAAKAERVKKAKTYIVQVSDTAEIKSHFISDCHIRALYSVHDEQESQGYILLCRVVDMDNKIVVFPIQIPEVQHLIYESNSAILKNVSKALVLATGGRASIRADPKNSLGHFWVTDVFLKSLTMTYKDLQIVQTYGLLKNTKNNKQYFSMKDNEMFEIGTRKTISPIDAGFYIHHVGRRKKGESKQERETNYPTIHSNQEFCALSDDHIQQSYKIFGLENIILLCVMWALCAINFDINILKTYGGVTICLLLYSLPHTGKSLIVSMAQAVYGIIEFSCGARAAGTSTLKISNYTTAGCEDQGQTFDSYCIYGEDIDRGGNKAKSGGPTEFTWAQCDFAKKITRGNGCVSGSRCNKVGTCNSDPCKDKKFNTGTYSRQLIWLFTSHFCASITKLELSKQLYCLANAVAKRSIYILTMTPSIEHKKNACTVVDQMKHRLESDNAELMPFYDARHFDQWKLIIPYTAKIAYKLFKIKPQQVSATIYSAIVRHYSNELEKTYKPKNLIDSKYTAEDQTKILFFLNLCLYALECDLTVNYKILYADKMELDSSESKCEWTIDEIITKQNAFNELEIMKFMTKTMIRDEKEIDSKCYCISSVTANHINLFRWVEKLLSAKLITFSESYLFEEYISSQREWKEVIELFKFNNNLKREVNYNTTRISKVRYWAFASDLLTDITQYKEYNTYEHLLTAKKTKKKTAKNVKTNKNVGKAQNVIENVGMDLIHKCNELDFHTMLLEKISQCLTELQQMPQCSHFLNAVDLETYPSYTNIIEKPMDLSIIQNKIENKIYKNVFEFDNDIRLMISNCLTFNENGTEIFKNAQFVQGIFSQKFSLLYVNIIEIQQTMNKEKQTKKISKITGVGQRDLKQRG